MRAVIMAGGRGERLRPLTDTCPKPLLPVAGRPVLDRLLEKLGEAGIQDVTLAVGYLGAMIEDYVGDGARWGVRADYVRQVQPMGTAGALSLLTDKSKPVLVVNGDKVFELASDIRRVADSKMWQDAGAFVGTVPLPINCGVFYPDRDYGECFEEKPTFQASAGIYVIWPKDLRRVREYEEMTDLMGWAHSVELRGYVLDIGTPATYEAACARLS